MPPLFSIIIPTCHRNELLALCLNRLAPGVQTLEASQYEVIVSDDGKNNDARELIETKYPWAQWTPGSKRGPAANRNNGAKLAKAEWLVFTDDDCLPDANWLQAYAQAIQQHPECKAFEGAILPDDWTLLKKDMAECPVNDKGGCFWSANIMVEKELYWQVGGFDEQFTIAAQEDQDIFEKLRAKTIVPFVGMASVVHPVRFPSMFSKLKKIPSGISNWTVYASKNQSYWSVLSQGFSSQSIAFKANCINRKFRLAFLNMMTSIFLLPISFKQYFFNGR